MDKEFAEVLYRALMMICRWLEKKFGFGKRVEIPTDKTFGKGFTEEELDNATRTAFGGESAIFPLLPIKK